MIIVSRNPGIRLSQVSKAVFTTVPASVSVQEAECSFVLLLMAVFWMTEVIPLAMAAMLPAILFPIFGIMKSSDVSRFLSVPYPTVALQGNKQLWLI